MNAKMIPPRVQGTRVQGYNLVAVHGLVRCVVMRVMPWGLQVKAVA
jgi:hypothetical protein